jgi:hypothetical protein
MGTILLAFFYSNVWHSKASCSLNLVEGDLRWGMFVVEDLALCLFQILSKVRNYKAFLLGVEPS